MPTYEYRCPEGHTFDVFQRMSDEPGATCPECGKDAERVISGGAGFLFKGEGFYITDYRSEGYKEKAEAEKGSGAKKKEAGAADGGSGGSNGSGDAKGSDSSGAGGKGGSGGSAGGSPSGSTGTGGTGGGTGGSADSSGGSRDSSGADGPGRRPGRPPASGRGKEG